LLFKLLRLTIYAACRCYFRIEFRGAEGVPTEGPVIIAPNHVSYLDPIWVSLPVGRRLRYMTWDRMFAVPVLGPLMRAFGAFPVKVETGDRAALRLSLTHLRSGGALMVFPEGSRSRTGGTQPFKPGVIRLALDTRAPIVPVTIIGGYRAFSPWHRFPRPRKVSIIFHAPLNVGPPADLSESKDHLREQCRQLERIVTAALPAGPVPGLTRDPQLPARGSVKAGIHTRSSD
jgi:1-acyl-sn-glycerol-3-phosphate acyltransferase